MNTHIVLDTPGCVIDERRNDEGRVRQKEDGHVFLLTSNDEESCSLAIAKFRNYVDHLTFESVDDEVKRLATL